MENFTIIKSSTSANTGNTVSLAASDRHFYNGRMFTCEKRMPVQVTSSGYPQEAAVYVDSAEIWSGTLTADFPVAQFDIYDYISGMNRFILGIAADDGTIAKYNGVMVTPNTAVGREAEAVAPDALRWDAERSDAWICIWSTSAGTYRIDVGIVTFQAFTSHKIRLSNGWAFINGEATLLRGIKGGFMVFWKCKDTGLLKGWCFELVGRGTLAADVRRDAGGLRQETRDCGQYVEVRTTGCSARDAAYLRSLNYSDDINTADDGEGTTLYLLDEVPAVAYGERETVSLRFETITIS